MSTRLPTGLLIGALLRRVNDSGGFGAVLAKGDPQAGGALLLLVDRDGGQRLVERGIGADGKLCLIDSTPPADLSDYCRRRRDQDPDLWIVELNTPDAERFAAETMLVD
ncbi:MAG TPA: DUF1491 family protein [Sphingomonas sp.]|jgi:hypothetical protein|nr:DUF1491 family protein [Sphingomonas sp.]